MDVVVLLRSLGLGKYEAAFRDNDIDETVLPSLTAEPISPLARFRVLRCPLFSRDAGKSRNIADVV
jgi:hypothetical protein